jgi:CRP-like cAMP-binding protein
MESILDVLKSQEGISSNQFAQFEHLVSVKKISKGEMILRIGEPTKKSFFVKQGCLRSYSIDEKGKEHIFMFAPEGWVISDISKIGNSQPSDLFIDAIEDSEIEVVDRSFFDLVYATLSPNVSFLANEKLINRIAVLQKRVIMLMSATAWERYEDFLETYPNIIQRVPQRMVASYLGITPEALSKLRGTQMKK